MSVQFSVEVISVIFLHPSICKSQAPGFSLCSHHFTNSPAGLFVCRVEEIRIGPTLGCLSFTCSHSIFGERTKAKLLRDKQLAEAAWPRQPVFDAPCHLCVAALGLHGVWNLSRRKRFRESLAAIPSWNVAFTYRIIGSYWNYPSQHLSRGTLLPHERSEFSLPLPIWGTARKRPTSQTGCTSQRFLDIQTQHWTDWCS